MLTSAKSTTGDDLAAYIGDDGVPRMLAAIPTGNMMAPAFSVANPVIPRSEWQPVKRRRGIVPILDQKSSSSCTGHGAVTALMLARDQAGMTYQLLSPTFIYAHINQGRDQGSNPGHAADHLVKVGTCTYEECGLDRLFKHQVPPEAYETAKRFKINQDGIYQCRTFDEIVSAFILGFTIFDTVNVAGNFGNLDQDGVAPVTAGPGNHCIVVGEELKRDKRGRWCLEHRNSWTTRWGIEGRYFAVEDHFGHQPHMEAFAIKDVISDLADVSNPPAVVA